MKHSTTDIKFYKLPFLDGVEAVSGNNVTNVFRRHIHKTYTIGAVENGQRVITHKKETFNISQGEVFVLNPYQVHTCTSINPSGHSYKVISVPLDKMTSVAGQISNQVERHTYFHTVRYTDQILSESFLRLFMLIEASSSSLEIESEMNLFLSDLLLRFSGKPLEIGPVGEQKKSMEKVCDYIATRYTNNLSLNELSRVASLSPFHFQRVFIKTIGISAHDYIMQYRIRKSKKMLLESNDISDTAITVGFVDQSHFSKVFKKLVGIPPGTFIKNNQ